MNWVVLTVTNVPEQLHLLRSKLESEGIPTRTRDENTIQVDPLLSHAVGGVKLLVPEDKAEEAVEVMSTFPDFIPADQETSGHKTMKWVPWVVFAFLLLVVILYYLYI